jgi:hypothetical protein
MTGNPWKRLIVAVLNVSLALRASTTLRDVPMPVATAARAPNVHTGDVVRVPFEDIQNLQRRESSGWKSAMLIGAGAVVVLAGLLLYALIKSGD